MNRPLISIIIPVYNADSYLEACLDSIISQNFTDWEAICVDDGSTDSSLDILHRYAERDSRIRILHQPNSGVSVARNHGINAAQGHYLTMVDSDDVLPQQALLTLAEPARRDEKLDLIIGNTLWLEKENEGYRPIYRKPLIYGAKETGVVENLGLLALQISGLPSSKLYKKDIIDTHKIFYNSSIHIGEDHELTLRFLLHTKRAYVTPEVVYHYMIRNSSTMGKFDTGLLPLQDYINFPVSSLHVARLIPADMEPMCRGQFAQALVFFFVRDFLRGFNALWEPRPELAHKLLRTALREWRVAKPYLHGAGLRCAWQQMRTLEPKAVRLLKKNARKKLKQCPLIIPLLFIKRLFKKQVKREI